MPQLNVLSVNVSKNTELKDESVSFDSTTSKDDFSKYIDLHLNKSKGAGDYSKVDTAESAHFFAKDSSSSTETKFNTKKSDSLVENSDQNVEKSTLDLVQKVAASGNKSQIQSNKVDSKVLSESEQLMSFLNKADNTLINQSMGTSSPNTLPEQLSPEQKAHYEAQLLINSSYLVADLSVVAKALANDQVGVSLAPTVDNQADPAEESLLSSIAKENNVVFSERVNESKAESKVVVKGDSSVKLPAELLVEGKNKNDTQDKVLLDLATSKGQKIALSEPKIGSKTEAKAIEKERDRVEVLIETKTKTKNDSRDQVPVDTVTPTEKKVALSELNIEAKAGAEVKVTTVNNNEIKVAPHEENKILSSEALGDRNLVSKNSEEASLTVVQKEIKQIKSDEKTNQDILPKKALQSSESEVIERSQLSENKNINAPSQSTIINQAQSDTLKSIEKTVKTIGTQANLSKQPLQEKVASLTDPQLIKDEPVQNSGAITFAEKTHQPSAQVNKNTLLSNQSATDDFNQDEAKQIEVKQSDKAQLSSILAEKGQQKIVAQDEVLVEDKAIASVNKSASVNGRFMDVSGKAMQTPFDAIGQPSAEILNPGVATEVTQSQKTNAQLHQETISLFRKDFTEAVKDKVMLVISQKLQQFDIVLDPPELGNMQVRVNLQGEQAAVSFLVQSQQTKDALEQHMHKLRELLAEQGVDVGDANVEQQSQQSPNEEGFTAESHTKINNEVDNMTEADDVVSHTLSAQMIDSSTATVDYYA